MYDPLLERPPHDLGVRHAHPAQAAALVGVGVVVRVVGPVLPLQHGVVLRQPRVRGGGDEALEGVGRHGGRRRGRGGHAQEGAVVVQGLSDNFGPASEAGGAAAGGAVLQDAGRALVALLLRLFHFLAEPEIERRNG